MSTDQTNGRSGDMGRRDIMIPSVLAAEARKVLGDYLSTTFHCTTRAFKGTLDRLITSGRPFKGPYLTLHLPFEKGTHGGEWFPEIPLQFQPYKHQELAFERLTADEPKPTIVATGTGSGKTEAFLLPILEQCRQNAGKKGIKAILIYPMNALATDQARRIARLIYNTESLKGNVRAGLFIGGDDKEPQALMSETSIITSRDMMRDEPPDILLTNYKMLDLLMVRGRDALLWAKNSPGTLRFLVVDELHTFDGAQGTDLACLLRRLKARLQSPDACPVGTSATLGVGDQATQGLREYAGKIFDCEFDSNAIIREHRVTAGQFLEDKLISPTDIPTDFAPGGPLDPTQYSGPNEYVAGQYAQWFREPIAPERVTEPELHAQLGERMMQLPAFRNLLVILKGRTLSMDEVAQRLTQNNPITRNAASDGKQRILESLLALTSVARHPDANRSRPLVDIRLEVWIREMRRMVASVEQEVQMTWANDVMDNDEEDATSHLPMVLCRNCGTAAWGGTRRQNDHNIRRDLTAFYAAFFDNQPDLCLIFPGEQEEWEDRRDGKVYFLCAHCLSLHRKHLDCPCNNAGDLICVFVPDLISTTNGRSKAYPECPNCDSHYGISIVGAQASSISAVIASQVFASQYNGDKKLLAFSDSVQDASHRAGFFQGRTFQFTVRSALAQYLRSVEEAQTLEEAADGFCASLRRNYENDAFVGTFIAPDLLSHAEYDRLEDNDKLPSDSDLPSEIAERLHWEVFKAFGHWARIGRSLEKVLVAAAAPRPRLLHAAREAILEPLRNEVGGLKSLTEHQVEQFLTGLLYHLRVGGGVYHDALKGYITSMGDPRKMQPPNVPYLPRRAGRRTPVFVTDGKSKRFRSIVQRRQRTWFSAWQTKCLAPENAVTGLDAVVIGLVIEKLEEASLLNCHYVKGKRVWSIPGSALRLSTDVHRYHCSTCGHELTVVDWEQGLWADAPCMSFSCTGNYGRSDGRTTDYYRNLYQTADIKRIVAREHTGILTRQTREELEQRFIQGNAPWHPNIISCTPTLELGIDIGDLSSLILCSVPPTSSNYFQRTGRAGRHDGNAISYTLANARSHDLYFFEDPEEMIAGGVTPPGVFLDAPAVLERQLAAYSMDRWVDRSPDPEAVPAKLRSILSRLGNPEATRFPDNWITYIKGNRQSILDGFFALFQDELSDTSRSHLRQFLSDEGLPLRIHAALQRVQADIEALVRRRRAVQRRDKSLEAKPRDLNYDRDKRNLEQEKRCISSRLRGIRDLHVYNFLTDAGLLPNYSFPEPGVILQSEVYSASKDKNPPAATYSRPAAAAIRELAPGNTFYAEGRRIEISRLDLSSSDREPWRFCDQCAHAEMTASPEKSKCPACGSPGWSDVGQQADMRELEQVAATSEDRKSRSFDDTELRKTTFYSDRILVSFEPTETGDAFGLEEDVVPFGVEYLRRATFRHINFGLVRGTEPSVMIAGQPKSGSGFKYCEKCGATRDQNGFVGHTYSCSNRGAEGKPLSTTYLYRELQTEAIRMLLPLASPDGNSKEVASFVAGLQLGLKKYFGGAVDHLKITEQDEPIEGVSFRQHFVFLYDTVPGGTGYLKDLMKEPGTFIEVLKRATSALAGCKCTISTETDNDDPSGAENISKTSERDGCYACLLAYRNSQSHTQISRDTALSLFSKIIDRQNELKFIDGLSEVKVNKLLDSTLEHKFIALLESRVKQEKRGEFGCAVVRGKDGYTFTIDGEVHFEIEPQASLGKEDNVSIPSLADFVIWPSDPQVLPVAVFTDGFKYHNDRIGFDTAQRTALLWSEKFAVWSLTWEDVHENVGNSHYTGYLSMDRPGDDRSRFRTLAAHYSKHFGKLDNLKDRLPSSLDLLFEYLLNPQKEPWQGLPFPHKSSITVRLFVSSGQLSLAWLSEYLGYFDLTGMVCDLR